MKKIAILFLVTLSLAAFSQNSQDVTRTISVTGRGELTVKPDTVIINTGVDSSNQILAEALKENNRVMNKIFRELNRHGIGEEDIKTSFYNVNFHTPYKKNSNEIEEYRVSNSVEVKVNNIHSLDRVIDSLIKAGANRINGINFTFRDVDKYKNDLSAAALKNAREKADFLAKEEGMVITGVISISEEQLNNSPGAFRAKLMAADSGAALAPGNHTLSISYNVVYQMETK